MPTTYAIPDGRTVMAATTYTGVTGGGSVVNTVNGVGFQPDFVWMKCRSVGRNHELADSVRGTPYALFSNVTNQEVSDTRVSAFNSNGFSYGTNSNSAVTGDTEVGWQWKGGGTASTIAIGSISSGVPSIASSVSANTAAGFSVVTYTGTGVAATIGHGLGATPKMIILCPRNNTGYIQPVWHTSLGGSTDSDYLALSNIGARNYAGALTGLWNSTAPTSSVFSIGTSGYSNTSTKNYVAYCFAAVAGYSAFGSYTGNNLLDGPFIYLGFRPAFIMIKRTDVSSDWFMMDNARPTFNVIGAGNGGQFAANQSYAESTLSSYAIADFLSNGVKIRSDMNYGYLNASGGTYIYAAFAENPFKYANAR